MKHLTPTKGINRYFYLKLQKQARRCHNNHVISGPDWVFFKHKSKMTGDCCIFKFLQRSVDCKRSMCFQSENSVFTIEIPAAWYGRDGTSVCSSLTRGWAQYNTNNGSNAKKLSLLRFECSAGLVSFFLLSYVYFGAVANMTASAWVHRCWEIFSKCLKKDIVSSRKHFCVSTLN